MLPLHIDQIAYGGRGIARHEGKVCFIPGVLTGETIEAEITKDRGDFCEARALSVLEPSPARIHTACPLALAVPAGNRRHPTASTPTCPGCCYQHMTYDEELRIKHSHLCSLLERQSPGTSARCNPAVASPLTLGYRNKMALHVTKDPQETRLGYFMDDNTTIVDIPACPLAMHPLNNCLAERRASASFMHGLRDGMTITFRWTERDGAVWWRGRAAENDVWMMESSPIGPLSVPRNSFYQTNPAVAGLLVKEVIRLLANDRPERVVDLYCGVGIFALVAAQQGVPKVFGLDVDGPALKAADHNGRKLGFSNIQWIAGSASKTSLVNLGKTPGTTVIVDPPRTGLGRAMVQELIKLAPQRILYISCAADTMARDAAWLLESGYSLRQSQVFDMFPRTPHFESLTELVAP
jgi:23S rRNA (uracil1939-C5)-methyltransferase